MQHRPGVNQHSCLGNIVQADVTMIWSTHHVVWALRFRHAVTMVKHETSSKHRFTSAPVNRLQS